MKSYAVLLLISFFMLSAQAQDDTISKTGNLEIRIGLNTLGPVWKMSRLMIDNDFDETTSNFFSGGTITHPRHDPIGFSSQISWTQPLKSNKNIGFIFNFSYLRQVTGYSLIAEWLTVSFSSISVAAPVLGFIVPTEPDGIHLQAGPVLMINTGKETGTGQYPEKYKKISPGIFSGISYPLWDKRLTFGNLGLQFISGIPLNMGPFVAENFWGDRAEIPEAKYWFGYLTINFSLGFHL